MEISCDLPNGEESDNEFHGELELSQLVEFPGKRTLRIAIADQNIQLRELAQQAVRFQLSSAVTRAFYKLLSSQEVLNLRREQAKSAESFSEVARKRVQQGYATEFELIKARAELIGASKKFHEAEADVTIATAVLNALLGRASSAPLGVSGTLDDVLNLLAPASPQQVALQKNPSLRAQLVEMQTAALKVDAARISKRPDFSVGPTVEYVADEQIYGLGVSLPLPVWDAAAGEIQTASAEERKTKAEFDRLQLELQSSIAQAEERFSSARKQLALYSPDTLSKLKSFISQAERSYATNATSLIIYLDAKKTYFDTFSDYYETLANVAGAYSELESAVGVPLGELHQ